MSSVVIVKEPTTVVHVAQAGLPGPPGPPGSGTYDPDALHVSMRLAEFDTPQAKAEARMNLGLQYIDCGEF